MALKIYTDTHIAKAVAVQLRAKDIDVIRCEEVGMAEASDDNHLLYSTEKMYVLLSQDDDFAGLHASWQKSGKIHSGIMLLPKHLQGEAQISYAVRELLFFEEAERAGAIDLMSEIQNQLIYL